MQKNSFVLQTRLNAIVAKLSERQAGILFKGILNYAENGIKANFDDGMVDVVFEMVRQDIDYTANRYAEICKKNAENGRLGGRPKNPNKPNGYFKNPKKPNGYFQKHNDVDNDVDNELVSKLTNNNPPIPPLKVGKEAKPLDNIFKKWLAYRKQIKKPFKSQLSIDEAYKRLEKLSNGDVALAEQIVNQSIAQGWQGLFEIKGAKNNGAVDYNGKDADKSKYDEFCKRNTKVFYNN